MAFLFPCVTSRYKRVRIATEPGVGRSMFRLSLVRPLKCYKSELDLSLDRTYPTREIEATRGEMFLVGARSHGYKKLHKLSGCSNISAVSFIRSIEISRKGSDGTLHCKRSLKFSWLPLVAVLTFQSLDLVWQSRTRERFIINGVAYRESKQSNATKFQKPQLLRAEILWRTRFMTTVVASIWTRDSREVRTDGNGGCYTDLKYSEQFVKCT